MAEEIKKKLRDYTKEDLEFNEPHFSQQNPDDKKRLKELIE